MIYDLGKTPKNASDIIDEIGCNTNEYSVLHIHAHLNLFINENPVSVPAQIGS